MDKDQESAGDEWMNNAERNEQPTEEETRRNKREEGCMEESNEGCVFAYVPLRPTIYFLLPTTYYLPPSTCWMARGLPGWAARATESASRHG